MGIRIDGRNPNELREVKITPGYLLFAEGSALIEMGHTRVICAVNIEERVPPHKKGTNSGWLTSEYSMLPASTPTRSTREITTGRPSGRTQEIQRLIGRSLRAVIDLDMIGERTIMVDCDVLQADGGTRTAAINGAYIALVQAVQKMIHKGILVSFPLKSAVAAVSVGIVDRVELLDLCYDEDSQASVDFNVVMTSKEEFVEVQGTAETQPFNRDTLSSLISLAETGIKQLFEIQRQTIEQMRF